MRNKIKNYKEIEKNYAYDELALFFGQDYVINDKIRLHQPTIGEIVEYGERAYFQTVYSLCAIPSDMKSVLDDMGLDYVELPDFELFMLLTRRMTPKETGIFFGELDFQAMKIVQNKENGQVLLWDEEKDIRLDEKLYFQIVTYLRMLHGIVPKPEYPATKTVRRILLDEDRKKREKSKEEVYHSQLKQLISGMMRYPGFKYKKSELWECGLYEFMDAVKGAQVYVQSTALLKGMYSGMIDTSKINKKELDWMRNI